MIRWFLSIAFISTLALGACAPEDAAPPPLPMDANSVVRGQQLVEGFGACGSCHSMQGKPEAPLSGGRVMRDIFGEILAPNITTADSGIGNWGESDVRTLFRSNRRPDGSTMYSPFHRGFEWMSDADLTAIIAYLRTIPATENTVEHRELSFIDRNTTGFFLSKSEVKGYVPSTAQSFRAEYGEYVTNNIAGCARCHSKPSGIFSSSEYLAGGQEIVIDGESKIAPNITSSKVAGIGEWSEDDLKRYLRSGKTPTGREVDKRFCPIDFYQRAASIEVDALVAYLRSVQAID